MSMSRRYTYNRMTAEQLSAALNQLNLSLRQFCRLSGKSEAKAQRWIAGKEDIPHDVAVMLALLTVPGAMDVAKAVTDAFLIEEREDA